MRVQPAGPRYTARLAAFGAAVAGLAAFGGGMVAWLWTQAARLAELETPMRLPVADAARATWRLVISGAWSDPAGSFPTILERRAAPSLLAYLAVAGFAIAVLVGVTVLTVRAVRRRQAGSPLGVRQGTLARYALDRGLIRQRTWARPSDLRRLWVAGSVSGRPYLGMIGRFPRRMLAAELEVQPMVVAPPRAGKSTAFVIPWLLEHDGPAVVLSTKRDVYEATAAQRERVGRVWVYDPFGSEHSAGFTPLVPAASWPGAIRAGEALASAAHPDASNAANEFWDKEAASMLAPLLHAAAISDHSISDVIRWLDARDFTGAIDALTRAQVAAAADQLEGVSRRDERNRETTVMSALNLLRAYRYPQVAAACGDDLTTGRFLDGAANTVFVVAAGHEQEALRPVILSLITACYEAAILKAREHGPLQPRLFLLMDEAANIAPVRNLAAWLSQCGDHGIVIATVWQSIAQIDQRYGRAARDAICAASTAQLFIPPLADPTTTSYLEAILGIEPVSSASGPAGHRSFSVVERKTAPTPWLRQVARGHAILIYRDLPPAILTAAGWYERPGLPL